MIQNIILANYQVPILMLTYFIAVPTLVQFRHLFFERDCRRQFSTIERVHVS